MKYRFHFFVQKFTFLNVFNFHPQKCDFGILLVWNAWDGSIQNYKECSYVPLTYQEYLNLHHIFSFNDTWLYSVLCNMQNRFGFETSHSASRSTFFEQIKLQRSDLSLMQSNDKLCNISYVWNFWTWSFFIQRHCFANSARWAMPSSLCIAFQPVLNPYFAFKLLSVLHFLMLCYLCSSDQHIFNSYRDCSKAVRIWYDMRLQLSSGIRVPDSSIIVDWIIVLEQPCEHYRGTPGDHP